jgi:hypothetical protein
MPAPVAVRVEGLRTFTRALKDVDRELPKAVRLANNRVATIVVDAARPEVPVKSGRAKATLKAKSTRTAVRVQAGSKRVPYYGWLDFGGKTGIDRSVSRPFYTAGRYIYPSYSANGDQVVGVMVEEYSAIARDAGLDVSS